MIEIFQDPPLINYANDFSLIKIIWQGNIAVVNNGVWEMKQMCTTTNVNKWIILNLHYRCEER